MRVLWIRREPFEFGRYLVGEVQEPKVEPGYKYG